MNKIPIIRKGSYKDYISNSLGGGFIVGLLFFILSLTSNSVIKSLWIGLGFWIGIILLFIGVGFPIEEYFKRKKRLQKLYSDKYSFLDICNFTLHQDLYFYGIYNDFHFRVLSMSKYQERKKDIEYIIIEAYYQFDTDQNDYDKELKLCGDYFLGHLRFVNHCVGFVPKDYNTPDFKENFDGLISIFKQEKLLPLSKTDWDNTYGKMINDIEINSKKANNLHSRIKKILDKIDKPAPNTRS